VLEESLSLVLPQTVEFHHFKVHGTLFIYVVVMASLIITTHLDISANHKPNSSQPPAA